MVPFEWSLEPEGRLSTSVWLQNAVDYKIALLVWLPVNLVTWIVILFLGCTLALSLYPIQCEVISSYKAWLPISSVDLFQIGNPRVTKIAQDYMYNKVSRGANSIPSKCAYRHPVIILSLFSVLSLTLTSLITCPKLGVATNCWPGANAEKQISERFLSFVICPSLTHLHKVWPSCRRIDCRPYPCMRTPMKSRARARSIWVLKGWKNLSKSIGPWPSG